MQLLLACQRCHAGLLDGQPRVHERRGYDVLTFFAGLPLQGLHVSQDVRQTELEFAELHGRTVAERRRGA